MNTATLFKKDDYILSFWAQGVSVFVTDIHLDAYRELEVLYIIDKGTFKQYFKKEAFERSLDRGLAFYSDGQAFDRYQEELIACIEDFKRFFAQEIQSAQSLSPKQLRHFFTFTIRLCADYAKMNFEFTDKAFAAQEENSTIKENLAKVAGFKDVVRTFMNEVLFEPEGYCAKLFAVLGTQFGIRPSILEGMSRGGLLNLFNGRMPDEAAVAARQEAFVESDLLHGYREGEEARTIADMFKEDVQAAEAITGQVASKGRATGKVKVIPVDYSDFSRVNAEIAKMDQGDILVAETTAPELMAACKKAAAIVTDMGGLLSHAAIVSRELGIPCIVGTKTASKALKDGDMVEVDAERGTVRVVR